MASFEPIGEGVEVAGEGLEDPDRHLIAALGDGGIDVVVADVEASGIEIDLLQGVEVGGLDGVRWLSLGSFAFRH
jgi:hypothetical protein